MLKLHYLYPSSLTVEYSILRYLSTSDAPFSVKPVVELLPLPELLICSDFLVLLKNVVTSDEGIAKLIFAELSILAVIMPTSLPFMFNNAPPLLPLSIGAESCT